MFHACAVYRALPSSRMIIMTALGRRSRNGVVADSDVVYHLQDDIHEPRPWSNGWEAVVTDLGMEASTTGIRKLRVKQWYERLLFPLELRLRDACISLGAGWPIKRFHPLHTALQSRTLFTALKAQLPCLFIVSATAASMMMRCACGHRHEYKARTVCVVCTQERGRQVQGWARCKGVRHVCAVGVYVGVVAARGCCGADVVWLSLWVWRFRRSDRAVLREG